MSLTADIFPKKAAPKNMVRSMSKKLCLTLLFDRQHGKWVETLLQSERHHLCNNYLSLWR